MGEWVKHSDVKELEKLCDDMAEWIDRGYTTCEENIDDATMLVVLKGWIKYSNNLLSRHKTIKQDTGDE